MRISLPTLYDSLTPSQKTSVRKEYCKLQKGKCWYCGKSLRQNMYPVKYPVHLHHSHRTGLTLGAVHEFCNITLYLNGDRRKRHHQSVVQCFVNVAFASCRFCEWGKTVRSKQNVVHRAWMLLERHVASTHPTINTHSIPKSYPLLPWTHHFRAF